MLPVQSYCGLRVCESSPSVKDCPGGFTWHKCTAHPASHLLSTWLLLHAQRIASSGAFLVTSEMALFQLCGDAKVCATAGASLIYACCYRQPTGASQVCCVA